MLNRTTHRYWTLGIAATLALGTLALFVPRTPASEGLLSCAAVPRLMEQFLSHHIKYKTLTDELRDRTVSNMIKSLDPSKSLFLKSEADAMAAELKAAFPKIREGECNAIASIQAQVISRAKQAAAHVKTVLEPSTFKIDETVEITADPDKREYPLTPKDREELLRKLVHFRISNSREAGTPMPEAKRQLLHGYELLVKRENTRSSEDLYSGFLKSFALALDPHTGYLSADDLSDFQISMGLSLEGIGASLSSQDGYTVIEEIIPGGAADRANALAKKNKASEATQKGAKSVIDTINPKDKIIGVAQKGGKSVNVIDMDLRDVVKLIRGKKGTQVTLTILRQDGDKTSRFSIQITRDKVDLAEQAAKLTYETAKQDGREFKLAIIDLPSFYGDRDTSKRSAMRDMETLLNKARKEKADGVLLDLSRNGGGLLDYAVRIAGLLTRKGGMVATEMSGAAPEVLEDDDSNTAFNGPVVVVTSRLSASASEIVAGALKDYKRAIIVGDSKTFGKGSVQTVISLPQGFGALKVTTGLFFRPGGQSTQHTGVAADIVVPSIYDRSEFGEDTLDYSLPPKKIDAFADFKEANDDASEGHWAPVSESLVAQLTTRSKERVKKSEEFKKVLAEIEKAKDKKPSVRLADLRNEARTEKQKADKLSAKKPDKKGKSATAASSEVAQSDSDKAGERSPQFKEAIQILADYVAISKGISPDKLSLTTLVDTRVVK